MGLLTRLSETRATIEDPNTPLSAPALWLTDWLGGHPTAGGVRINESNALAVGVLYAVVRVVAETLATVPLILYKRRGDRGKERARKHPLFPLLHDSPNERMSSYTWREIANGHLETWGNAYTEIRRASSGAVVGLDPLRPDRVEIRVKDGQLWYLYDETPGKGTPRAIASRNMLHVPGLGFDGIKGYSPIQLHREALGWNKSMEVFGSGWFGNGARPGGILSHPGRLKTDAKDRIKASWNAQHQGPGNAGGVAVLEEGLTWTAIGVPPEVAQFIQSKKFSVEDIARIWRMQLHKVQSLDRATFSNIEQQAIEHVVDTILPRATRWEQELNRKLLSGADRQEYFAEFLLDGLLRGDLKSRYDAYAVGRQWGWLSADDVRELENMNPLPRGQGGLYMVPLNMVPADQLAERTATPPATPPPADERSRPERRGLVQRRRIQESMVGLLQSAAARFTRREVQQVGRQVERLLGQRQVGTFEEWLREFYGLEGFQRTIAGQLEPVVFTFAEQLGAVAADEVGGDQVELAEFVRGYTATAAQVQAEGHRDQLLLLAREAPAEELRDQVDGRLTEWAERAPAKFASRHKVEAGSAIAKAVWIAAGIGALRWVTLGDNCPLCSEMSGRRVGISEAFLVPGDTVEPADGSTSPLRANSTHGHPPLHQGCDCSILPG